MRVVGLFTVTYVPALDVTYCCPELNVRRVVPMLFSWAK